MTTKTKKKYFFFSLEVVRNNKVEKGGKKKEKGRWSNQRNLRKQTLEVHLPNRGTSKVSMAKSESYEV